MSASCEASAIRLKHPGGVEASRQTGCSSDPTRIPVISQTAGDVSSSFRNGFLFWNVTGPHVDHDLRAGEVPALSSLSCVDERLRLAS